MVLAEKKRRAATAKGERITLPERRDAKAENISVFDAVRAFGVMAGPSALFDLFLLGSVIATIRGVLTRPSTRTARLLRPFVAMGTALAVAYPAVIRPWMIHWGATDEERCKPLPGDELVPNPITTSTRAITVDGPVEAVWPWLAPGRQDRAGFYSYDWLENLAGCKMHNADDVHPEWQQLAIGDVVKLHWAAAGELPPPFKVAFSEPNQVMVLSSGWAFVVEPLGDQRTRVIMRGRKGRGWPAVYDVLLIELPHFLMERKMLLGLKKRAEHAWRNRASGPPGDGFQVAPLEGCRPH